jgi:pseudouridine-5'-monophosphatase
MDGLLLDTETLYTQVYTELLAQWGKEFTMKFKLRLMGLSATESAALSIKEYNLPVEPAEFQQMAMEKQLEAFKECSLMPGVNRLLKHLASTNVPMAVATSSRKDIFNIKTASHPELFKLFAVVVNGDDPAVKRAKPFPDIFLTAAERLGVDPATCLALEDSPNGVRSALAAGMSVIWIPDPAHDFSVDHDDLLDHPEIQRLASMQDFRPDHWGLPFFK